MLVARDDASTPADFRARRQLRPRHRSDVSSGSDANMISHSKGSRGHWARPRCSSCACLC
eukprot:900442-Pyramimonas_sp.AAC.1